MRKLLLRTAVITGGIGAGILIGLNASNPAHADDQQPLPAGTIREVVEDVLPPRPTPEPTPEPGHGQPDPPPPSRPVEDAVEEIVDEVEDVVKDIVDTLPEPPTTPIDNPLSGQPVTPDTLVATPDTPTTGEPPNPDGELVSPAKPRVGAETGPIVTAGKQLAARSGIVCANGGHNNDREQQQDTPGQHAPVRGSPGEPHLTPATPGYRPPAPRPPTNPGHAVTRLIGATYTPTIGVDLPAIVTARTGLPHTTGVRIPGRDQAADGRNQTPDAPSG